MEVINESIFPDRQVVYAGFWSRFAAGFIDFLICYAFNYVIGYMADTGQSMRISGNLIGIIAFWLYDAVQESSNAQATLGKKALGIRVTTLNGNKLSFGQATGRHFGKYVSAVILFIGYLMMLWDDRSQTLHDKMAGALVIKSEY